MSDNKQEYILTQEGKNYHLTLEQMDSDTLKATCKEDNDNISGVFEGYYSFQELKEVNEIFYDFNSLEDAIASMDDSIVKHLCGVIEDDNMFEVVIYIDENNKKAKVPLLLEWNGNCRLGNYGEHDPDKIRQIERDNDQLRNDQRQLRNAIDKALGRGYQPKKDSYEGYNYPLDETNYVAYNKPTQLRSNIIPYSYGGNKEITKDKYEKLKGNFNDIKDEQDYLKITYDPRGFEEDRYPPNEMRPTSKTVLRSQRKKPLNTEDDTLDSKITNYNELDFVLKKINKYNNNCKLKLLYRGSVDKDKASEFHYKCDRAQSSVVLIHTAKGKRFGGYTTKGWDGDCEDKTDNDAFIFSIDKKQTYDIIPGKPAIGAYPEFGPIFYGCQIRIFDNYFDQGGTTYKKQRNYQTNEDFELTNGDQKFDIRELEVFEVEN